MAGDAKIESSETSDGDEKRGTYADEGSDGDVDDEEDLVTAMAATTLATSDWAKAPSYPALYMSTTSEYLPPAPKSNIPVAEEVLEGVDEKKSKDTSWTLEGYENSLDVDHAFERFSKRVGYEAEQCIRYATVL